MRRIFLSVSIALALCASARAQTKISALPSGTPAATDVVPYVADPSGTAATKKTTVANLFGALAPIQLQTSNKHGDGTKFQLFTGSSSTNDCAKFDANGNIVSNGGTCAAAAPVQSVFGRTGAVSMYTATAYPSTTVSIANASWISVALDSEEHDDGTLHDTATNNTRITVPSGATRCTFTGQVAFATNSTGSRYARLLKNGATALAQSSRTALSGDPTDVHLESLTLSVTGGTDYFELQGWQNSGAVGGLNATGGSALPTFFTAVCW